MVSVTRARTRRTTRPVQYFIAAAKKKPTSTSATSTRVGKRRGPYKKKQRYPNNVSSSLGSNSDGVPGDSVKDKAGNIAPVKVLSVEEELEQHRIMTKKNRYILYDQVQICKVMPSFSLPPRKRRVPAKPSELMLHSQALEHYQKATSSSTSIS